MNYRLLLISLITLSVACASKTKPVSKPTTAVPKMEEKPSQKADVILPKGVRLAVSATDFETTYALVRSTLVANPNTIIIKEIDHQKNAKSKGIELRPTRVILFDSPNQTSLFLAENPLIGLDLPLRILVYERDGLTHVMTNRVSYVRDRYEITAAMDSLFDMTTVGPETKSESTLERYQGVKIVQSNKNFDDTYSTLKQILTKNENLNIMTEYDFAAVAQNSGLTIQPTKLIIFGNPKLGTPLMKEAPSMALDLPQKMLIYSYKDTVHIAYNDPEYLGSRHHVVLPEVTKKISGALGMLSSKASE